MMTLNDGRSELWQWDTGRKLTVDAECSQVHFSNKVFGRSIDVNVVDGSAIIPDILLQTDKDLTAWAFIGTPENGYTKISKDFKVHRRNKPADYVFTPPEQTTLAEIMERLDDLESIQDPDAIKNAVDDYLANNPIKVEEADPTVPEWAKQPNPPDVKIPDKLPNPYSITFTGAVNVSYDGSDYVEIEIPDSGGNVAYDEEQELTEEQKAKARTNIGAARSLEITIPECSEYPVWLCDTSTDEYRTAIGQNSATCSLSYADFLTKYYDNYITIHDDGYSVSKKSLGRDSANRYDIYEYTFTPKRYSRTVMLSGGMNACELPAEFGIAYLMEKIMEKTDDSFAWLHDNVRFKIIPVICPWSFDQSPMVYENYNGVNLNKNFDYNHCWGNYSAGGAGTKGDAPCSEAETKMLLRWVNANANNCDLWIDCHTDSSGIADDVNAYLHTVICSDSKITTLITAAQRAITQAYVDGGYFESGAEKTEPAAWTEPGTNYPKTLYARHICGIPSIMIEQYVGNPYYGGIKTIANTEADINNYVTMLRAYVLAILKREAVTVASDDFAWFIYQSMMDKHFTVDNSELEPPSKPSVKLAFYQGGMNSDGSFGTQSYRVHSDFIEVPESGSITVTNLNGYEIVDLGVYEADKSTFRELTTHYTKTVTGNDWTIVMDRFSAYYPTGKYIVFSIKLIDAPHGAIDPADLADCEIIYN